MFFYFFFVKTVALIIIFIIQEPPDICTTVINPFSFLLSLSLSLFVDLPKYLEPQPLMPCDLDLHPPPLCLLTLTLVCGWSSNWISWASHMYTSLLLPPSCHLGQWKQWPKKCCKKLLNYFLVLPNVKPSPWPYTPPPTHVTGPQVGIADLWACANLLPCCARYGSRALLDQRHRPGRGGQVSTAKYVQRMQWHHK